jgi:hypothetical protein
MVRVRAPAGDRSYEIQSFNFGPGLDDRRGVAPLTNPDPAAYEAIKPIPAPGHVWAFLIARPIIRIEPSRDSWTY